MGSRSSVVACLVYAMPQHRVAAQEGVGHSDRLVDAVTSQPVAGRDFTRLYSAKF